MRISLSSTRRLLSGFGRRQDSIDDPVEATLKDHAAWDQCHSFTMTSRLRGFALMASVRYVVENGVPGDFVECGVWRGGSAMLMAQTLASLGVFDRRIWLYDTFAGMTPPSTEDVEGPTGRSASQLLEATPLADGNNVWCLAGRADVEANLALTDYPMHMFTLVEGDVCQTLQETAPSNIALLRLDTDWYKSTRAELELLYPRLSLHGVCMIDDYGHWEGARKAVDEYFAAHGPRPLISRVDYTGRQFVKTR